MERISLKLGFTSNCWTFVEFCGACKPKNVRVKVHIQSQQATCVFIQSGLKPCERDFDTHAFSRACRVCFKF